MSEESTQEEFEQEADPILNMSDEELLGLDIGEPSQGGEEEGTQEGALADGEEETGEEESESEEAESGEAEDDADEDEDSEEETDDTDKEGDDPEAADKDDPEAADDSSSEEGEEKESGEKTDAEKEAEAVDYKAAYERIFTPFKANGKEIKIDSVEDAIQLMQMGANYNKKMQALKPNLKTLKLLENNNLLSEEKLSYLIDLEKKNPEAIKKLVQDSGIDPLEIDTEKKSEYTPETYTVDEKELELDSVLDKIQDTPTYSKTVNLVSNKWDAKSKQVVADNPQLLEVINDHMASGIYDQISSGVEKERMLGRLEGMSDIDAYRHVGDLLHESGAFKDQGKAPAPEEKPPREKVVTRKPKAEDAKRKSKKRAASGTRTAPNKGESADFNPLSLSDDEFNKLINNDLM